MEPAAYQAWLSRQRRTSRWRCAASSSSSSSPASPAISTTTPAAARRWPASLARRWSSPTATGVVADDGYIRESILTPQMKLVPGYQPLMPTFQGLVNEEGVMSLIEYIKSLPRRRPRPAQAAAAPAARPAARGSTHDDHQHFRAVTYLNHDYGVTSWLLTKDHKRIGLMYMVLVTLAFMLGGVFAAGVRLELTTPAGDLVVVGHLQQAVHDARHRDGVLRADSGRAGHPRQLRPAADDRRQGRGVPEDQPDQLVHLRHRDDHHRGRDGVRRRGHGLDVLRALQHAGLEHQRDG